MVSRKAAKALRFEPELRPFDVPVLFASLPSGLYALRAGSGLGVKNSCGDWVAEVSRKGAKALRFSVIGDTLIKHSSTRIANGTPNDPPVL